MAEYSPQTTGSIQIKLLPSCHDDSKIKYFTIRQTDQEFLSYSKQIFPNYRDCNLKQLYIFLFFLKMTTYYNTLRNLIMIFLPKP